MQRFADINTWVFDLDNTLYPRHCDLFSQIDVLITQYVSNLTGLEPVSARKLQKELYRDYGTTLRGLMEIRDIDPHDFLGAVHSIDYSFLPKNPDLGMSLGELPGRRLVYTNGSVDHARNALAAMEIDHQLFDDIFDIVASDFEPKPHSRSFDKFLHAYDVDPKRAAMFEDLPRNLEPARASGMVTVLVTPQGEKGTIEAWEHVEENAAHIDHCTDDLEAFISRILEVKVTG